MVHLLMYKRIFYSFFVGLSPFPVIVTTRIVSCLVGNPYKPSFATITGKGDNPKYMDVSKNRGTPKWMVKKMENPIKMDDLGVPLFLETHILSLLRQKRKQWGLLTFAEFLGLHRQ